MSRGGEEGCRGTKENGYPSGLIHKHSCPTRRRQEVDDRRPKTTLTLPYIKGLSEAVRRILTPLDVKVVFRPLNTLRKMLIHLKDPVPSDQRKGIVYSIPCDGCPKVYIGQTGRSLKHRLAEHRCALKNGDVAASALAEHTLATGHPVALTKAEVIDHHLYQLTLGIYSYCNRLHY